MFLFKVTILDGIEILNEVYMTHSQIEELILDTFLTWLVDS